MMGKRHCSGVPWNITPEPELRKRKGCESDHQPGIIIGDEALPTVVTTVADPAEAAPCHAYLCAARESEPSPGSGIAYQIIKS